VLFSEVKTGVHMGFVAAKESRIGQRDVYWRPMIWTESEEVSVNGGGLACGAGWESVTMQS
jgi:hypothetical protein